jgi:hypothetical protein
MQAIILTLSRWHFSHSVISILKTRFSLCAQLMLLVSDRRKIANFHSFKDIKEKSMANVVHLIVRTSLQYRFTHQPIMSFGFIRQQHIIFACQFNKTNRNSIGYLGI